VTNYGNIKEELAQTKEDAKRWKLYHKSLYTLSYSNSCFYLQIQVYDVMVVY